MQTNNQRDCLSCWTPKKKATVLANLGFSAAARHFSPSRSPVAWGCSGDVLQWESRLVEGCCLIRERDPGQLAESCLIRGCATEMTKSFGKPFFLPAFGGLWFDPSPSSLTAPTVLAWPPLGCCCHLHPELTCCCLLVDPDGFLSGANNWERMKF